MGRTLSYLGLGGGGLLFAAALLLFDPWYAGTAPRWVAVYGLAFAALIGLLATARPRIGLVEIAMIAFMAWATITLVWSGDWRHGLHAWQGMAALFAIALMVRHTPSLDRVIYHVALIATAVLIALAWWRPEWHGGIGNANFLAETLLLLLALLMTVPAGKDSFVFRWLLWPLVMATVAYLFIWNDSTTQHAVLAGWVGILGWMMIRHRAWMVLGVLGMVILAAVVYAWHTGMFVQIGISFLDRAEIWINTAAMIAQHPLGGVGLGSFDFDYPRSAHFGLIDRTFLQSPTDYMGAAHNEYLQLWAELGVVGVLLAGWLVWAAVRGARGAHGGPGATYGWDARSVGGPVLLTTAMIACIGFPFQNPATAVLIAIALGLYTRGHPTPWRIPALNLRLGAGLAGLAAIPLAVSMFLFAAASVEIGRVHRGLVSGQSLTALQANIRAIDLYPYSAWPRLQVSLTLRTVLATHGERVQLGVGAADRFHEWAMTAAPRHPGVLLTRVEYLLNSGRWRDKPDEMNALFDRLREVGPHYPQGFALEAVYAGFTNDDSRAERAVMTALSLPMGAETFERMGMLTTEEPG